MSTKYDGGPAFPLEFDYGNGNQERAPGMTLRDYFAAKAMVGLMTMVSGAMQTIDDDNHLAQLAYAQADAMLKEGAK